MAEENKNINETNLDSSNQNSTLQPESNEYEVRGWTPHIYKVLPKVFIDGNTGVKIALTDQHVNCRKYESRTGLTFRGCYKFDGKFKELRGIHYVLDRPILILDSRAKIIQHIVDIGEMKNLIARGIKELERLINFRVYKQLLVVYDNYGFTIYDKWIEGRIIEFSVRVRQGHLYISKIPRPPELQYEKVKELSIYNHKIEFSEEVEITRLKSYSGRAIIIKNATKDYIDIKMTSPDHGPEDSWIPPQTYFLVTHPRPKGSVLD